MKTNKQKWAERNAEGKTSADVAVAAQKEANDDKIEIATQGKKPKGRRAKVTSPSAKAEAVTGDGADAVPADYEKE